MAEPSVMFIIGTNLRCSQHRVPFTNNRTRKPRSFQDGDEWAFLIAGAMGWVRFHFCSLRARRDQQSQQEKASGCTGRDSSVNIRFVFEPTRIHHF
jgi:hypothetical protein